MGKKEFVFTIYSKKAKKAHKYCLGKEQKSKSLDIKSTHKWIKMSKTC